VTKAARLGLIVPVVFAVVVALMRSGTASAQGVWQGVVSGDAPNIRSAPSTDAPVVGQLAAGQPVSIVQWVHGQRVEEVNETWGEIAPGEYIYSAELSKPLPAAPPAAPQTFSGHWIDANLTDQILTAYNGSTPAFWAVMSSGAPGTETETGVHTVLSHVPVTTMTSAGLAMAVEIPYDLPNVKWVQYFNSYGAAIHGVYWKDSTSPYGVPTSHGCMGLPEPQAQQFYNWTSDGSVINIHY
jgi:hypothetical protein